MKEEVFITKSAEETQELGQRFAEKMKGGDIIALYGDLGRGKTTFVQGLARGLGIKKRIISPTFNIIRRYEVSIKYKVLSIKYFFHVDLYRIEGKSGIQSLGIDEIINDRNNITVIEWAERMGDLLPEKRIDIQFEYLGEDKRKITVKIKY